MICYKMKTGKNNTCCLEKTWKNQKSIKKLKHRCVSVLGVCIFIYFYFFKYFEILFI